MGICFGSNFKYFARMVLVRIFVFRALLRIALQARKLLLPRDGDEAPVRLSDYRGIVKIGNRLAY